MKWFVRKFADVIVDALIESTGKSKSQSVQRISLMLLESRDDLVAALKGAK